VAIRADEWGPTGRTGAALRVAGILVELAAELVGGALLGRRAVRAGAWADRLVAPGAGTRTIPAGFRFFVLRRAVMASR
jgi:hypothetical protein